MKFWSRKTTWNKFRLLVVPSSLLAWTKLRVSEKVTEMVSFRYGTSEISPIQIGIHSGSLGRTIHANSISDSTSVEPQTLNMSNENMLVRCHLWCHLSILYGDQIEVCYESFALKVFRMTNTFMHRTVNTKFTPHLYISVFLTQSHVFELLWPKTSDIYIYS